MDLSKIQDKIKKEEYHISDHAIKRMIQREIERSELEDVILKGEIIEEYPDDKYSPSCLLYGETKTKRVLHIQVSLPPRVVVITTYEPSPKEWIRGKVRR